jgi:hypothetical protein
MTYSDYVDRLGHGTPVTAGERTARPEPVEGRAHCSWFDKLTTSGKCANSSAVRDWSRARMSQATLEAIGRALVGPRVGAARYGSDDQVS